MTSNLAKGSHLPENTKTLPNDGNAAITVAICTYNRHDYFKKLLPALERQTLSRELYTILIVDNSDDRSRREAFAKDVGGKPGLNIVHSAPPGLSRARNVALEVCKTKYIAYIDDDALPSSEWLAAILAGFDKSGAAAVAGPISPIWPGRQPDWLPAKYVACLTVLDLGPADRWLSEGEFAYGANMSFRVDALREIGGFNVALGRIGGRTLLSEEELEAQLALRARGHGVFYATAAMVSHMVHENRLSRSYFRARMAWQAVSALLRDPPLSHSDWSRNEIAQASARLGLDDLVSALVTYCDADTFSAQLDLIYHLFALFLESKDADDAAFEGQFTALAEATSRSPLVHRSASRGGDQILGDAYQSSAAVSLTTEHLFIEGRPGHSYLANLYVTLPKSQILYFSQDMYHDFDDSLQYLARSMTPQLRTITFLTVDALIYGPSRRNFIDFVRRSDVPCFGILHRLPENADHLSVLHEASRYMRSLIVLAEEIGDTLRGTYGVKNVSYLPLHPLYGAYLGRDPKNTRKAISASPSQVVFSFLGEARGGKGIELFLAALAHLSPDDREKMFFLVAGKATDVDAKAISNLLIERRCHGYVDLRQSIDRLKYRAVSDREFGEYINVTDFGLLLYQEEQRRCMSGLLPDYVWGYKRVIATANSVVGRLVRRHELGILVNEETAPGLAQTLAAALHLHPEGGVPTSVYKAFRAELAHDAVVDKLARILTGTPS